MTSIHFPHPREDFFCLIRTGFIITSIHFPHPREDQYHTVLQYLLHTSIHFPHPREDQDQYRCCYRFRYFNPLPSSEGRRRRIYRYVISQALQSTSLIRGKTAHLSLRLTMASLQSTSLIRGKTVLLRRIPVWSRTSIHFPHPREDIASGQRF